MSSADENDRIAARDIPASPLSPDDFRLILETKSLQSKLRQTELDNQIDFRFTDCCQNCQENLWNNLSTSISIV